MAILSRLVGWIGAHALEVIGALALTALISYVSVQVDDYLEPPRQAPAPDTVTVERTITKTDTVTETVAETVVQYDTIETTDSLYVPIPENFRFMGMVERTPLDIGPGRATLTYWQPVEGGVQPVQKRYDIPEPTWRIAPAVGLEAGPGGLTAVGKLPISYDDWTVTGGAEVTAGGEALRAGWTVGLSYTITEMTR